MDPGAFGVPRSGRGAPTVGGPLSPWPLCSASAANVTFGGHAQSSFKPRGQLSPHQPLQVGDIPSLWMITPFYSLPPFDIPVW